MENEQTNAARLYHACMESGIAKLKVALAYATDGAPHAAAQLAREGADVLTEAYDHREILLNPNRCPCDVGKPELCPDAGLDVEARNTRVMKPIKSKHKISAAGRAAISAAQKKRWAKRFIDANTQKGKHK